MITNIIWIVIIGNGMDDIDINATNCIYHLHKPVESNPGIIVDGNTKILVDGEATECNTSQSIGLVQLMQTTAGYIDPEITGNREHAHTIGCGVDRYHNIRLGK